MFAFAAIPQPSTPQPAPIWDGCYGLGRLVGRVENQNRQCLPALVRRYGCLPLRPTPTPLCLWLVLVLVTSLGLPFTSFHILSHPVFPSTARRPARPQPSTPQPSTSLLHCCYTSVALLLHFQKLINPLQTGPFMNLLHCCTPNHPPAGEETFLTLRRARAGCRPVAHGLYLRIFKPF